MKIFYHNDADGKASAYIAKTYMDSFGNYKFLLEMDRKEFDNIKCLSFNHGEIFPIENIDKDEGVVIVDFSLTPDVMSDLLDITKNVVWIDHHISAIEGLVDFKNVPGLRSIDFSGCELTWLFFHQKIDGHNLNLTDDLLGLCPKSFRLIGDRDVWRFKYGDQSKWFHEAFKLLGEPSPEDNESWDKLTFKTSDLMKDGKLLCEHSKMLNKASIDKWAYESYFHGFKILVCNSTVFSSELFGDRIKDYPFVAVYCHNGNNWAVSMYSENMDVVDIAKEHGGGGHPRACGFVSSGVPFEKIK